MVLPNLLVRSRFASVRRKALEVEGSRAIRSTSGQFISTQASSSVLRPAVLLHKSASRSQTRLGTSIDRRWALLTSNPLSKTSRFASELAAGRTQNKSQPAPALGPDSKVADSPEPEPEAEADPDEPPKKASIRERLRFLTRRYGWWALGVYLLASAADFTLVFVAIHMLGAEHIRELEDKLRDFVGMGKRQMPDHEVAAWPVPLSVEAHGKKPDGTVSNNSEAAHQAALRLQKQSDVAVTGGQVKPNADADTHKGSSNSSTWGTEAVLAYTIHKTLLLPFRVGLTAAITPSFVKYMVKLGWARNNAAVHQAAQKAKLAKQARQASTNAKS